MNFPREPRKYQRPRRGREAGGGVVGISSGAVTREGEGEEVGKPATAPQLSLFKCR